jgi:hypothetical protein
MPVAGTASRLRVRVSSPPVGRYTITLLKNGSATSLRCSIQGAMDDTCSDNASTVSFNAGQTLSWVVEGNAAANPVRIGISTVVLP